MEWRYVKYVYEWDWLRYLERRYLSARVVMKNLKATQKFIKLLKEKRVL